jgi:uncharacterized protein YkwD
MKRLLAALALALSLAACGMDSGPVVRHDPGRQVDNRTDFASRLLAAHNGERTRLGLQPLTWNASLATNAREWAESLARSGRFEHAPREARQGQGENLFTGTAGAYSLEEMIGGFLAERRDFRAGLFPDVSHTGRWEDVGHYTQIIWPATRELGCAIATGHGRDTLVCRYSPAGNIVGQRVG